MSRGPQEFLKDFPDCVFALTERLLLTKGEKAQLEEIRADTQLTAVRLRRWRARRAT